MSWRDRLKDFADVAGDVASNLGKIAAEAAMKQPEIKRRVDEVKDIYAQAKSQVESQIDDVESDLWAFINRMQEEAQRTHRQVDRARNAHEYYQVLGVRPGADLKTIKAAWLEKMRQNHPDRFVDDPEAEAAAQQRAQEINRAYEELKALLTGRENRRAP